MFGPAERMDTPARRCSDLRRHPGQHSAGLGLVGARLSGSHEKEPVR